MDKQNLIREKLNIFLKESGVTAKHVAIKCEIPQDILSRYRSKKKDLYDESLQVLEMFLETHN